MKKLLSIVIFMCMNVFLLAYSGGSGTGVDPYQIATQNDLIELSNTTVDWSKDFIQTADIVFNADETLVDWDGDGSATWDVDDALGMKCIGDMDDYFTGLYNGQYYTIENIYMNRASGSFMALFGVVTGSSTLEKIVLKNVDITGESYLGALIGYAYASGTISVYDCGVSGQISGQEVIGGLVGYSLGDVRFSQSYSLCNITAKGSAGGFVGAYIGPEGVDTYFSNCYARGNVTRLDSEPDNQCGAFASTINVANVRNCYSTGSIFYQEAADASGKGFIVDYDTPGFVGNFWDSEASNQTDCGPNAAVDFEATAKTTAQMKTASTFTSAGWDFVGESVNGDQDIWNIDPAINDGYPYLTSTSESATPITLSSFTAHVENASVVLDWTVESETNNAAFLIYRNDEIIARIEGAGSTSESKTYSYVDAYIVPSVEYTYVLADVDYANKATRYDMKAVTVTLSNEIAEADFVIGEAYPNPFNPKIKLSMECNVGNKTLVNIYNTQGKVVAHLYNGYMEAGAHELTWDANKMTSGIYVLKVVAGDMIDVQKITLLK